MRILDIINDSYSEKGNLANNKLHSILYVKINSQLLIFHELTGTDPGGGWGGQPPTMNGHATTQTYNCKLKHYNTEMISY